MITCFAEVNNLVERTGPVRIWGEVRAVSGLVLTAAGLSRAIGVGQRCLVHGGFGPVMGEVVGMDGGGVQILPFGTWNGVTAGQRVEVLEFDQWLRPDISWIGRTVDALGRPVDRAGPLPTGPARCQVRSEPVPAFARRRVGSRIETGVTSLDLFTPICRGQRMGIFAGSGVGKSSLLSRLARQAEADVIVIGLIGERGRELQDFIQKDLGPEGMARTVIVVSTGDEPPLMRRQAAWTATTIAEHFRDEGLEVVLMIDSVTRFAMAQREIGLSVGEPPAQRGFPPTTFAELPRLLERAGPGTGTSGDITAIYTVLVDGDDMDDPIADGVRGMLDGHIVLDRSIAERGRFPAVNLLKSVSRMLPGCHSETENALLKSARKCLARYSDMEDLIRLGAYQTGSDPGTDRAIRFTEAFESVLTDSAGAPTPIGESFGGLQSLLEAAGVDLPPAVVEQRVLAMPERAAASPG